MAGTNLPRAHNSLPMAGLEARLVLTPADLQPVPEHERELLVLSWLIRLPKTLAATPRVWHDTLALHPCTAPHPVLEIA